MCQYVYAPYIRHYGILGMKWGQRRYQNKNGSLTSAGKKRYQYTSMSTKRYTRKAEKARSKADEYARNNNTAKAKKYTAKAEKMANRAKRSAEVDANMQKYADTQSTGKAVVKTLLASNIALNPRAYKNFMVQYATGKTRARAMVSAYLTGDLGSMYAKRRYITQDERKKK